MRWRASLGRSRRSLNGSLWLGGGLLSLVVLLAISADVLFPGDPFEIVARPYFPPFAGEFLLGTDTLGRDIAAGVAHGARVTLMIGLIAALLITAIGVFVGSIAGFLGGRVDAALMRMTEIFQTVPSFLFAIVVVAVLQPSISSVLIAVVVVSWAPLARLVRAEVAAVAGREYVQASRALGTRPISILWVQVLPNAMPAVVVAGSVTVATSILFESGLSFLGLGDPNLMSWGLMIGAGRAAIRTAWWISAIPGMAILVTVLAINLLGDGLNDALNPHRKRSSVSSIMSGGTTSSELP